MTRWLTWLKPKYIVILIFLIWVVGVIVTKFTEPEGEFADEHAECPHTVQINGVTEVSIAGPITNVPEFHDCQRLIVHDSLDGDSYGPVVAVWVSQAIDTLFQNVAPLPDSSCVNSQAQVTEGRGGVVTVTPAATLIVTTNCRLKPIRPDTFSSEPVIQLYNFHESDSYARLGIQPGFSCVYMYMSQAGASAWIVSTKNQNACPRRTVADLDAPPSAAIRLEVNRFTVAGMTDDDYPPVARWDWDALASVQYLGVKCGAAWCELGLPGFKTSERLTLPAGSSNAGAKVTRVYLIPGWHDRQRLATMDANGNLHPGATFGTIVPDPRLKDLDAASFQHLPPVATVYLSQSDAGYREKMNFEGAPGGVFAEIKQQRSWSVFSLGPKWEAEIMNANGVKLRRRVSYISHPTLPMGVPGTARWRWRENDETTWNACLQGCCEVAGPG